MTWLTPTEISKLLKISRATAYKWVDAYIQDGGEHWRPTKKITRIPEEKFTEFLIVKKNK